MSDRSTQATSEDVARLARVSRATVNRALGGYGYVSDTALRDIRAAAAKLGYRPNAAARALLTGQSHTIGMVSIDVANPFFAGIMSGVCSVARQHGLDTFMLSSEASVAQEAQSVEALLEKRVDGLIVAPISVNQVDHLASVIEFGVPLVLIDRVPPSFPSDSVSIDNRRAGAEATDSLLTLGHTRVGIVVHLQGTGELDWQSWPLDDDEAADRLNPSAARLFGYLQSHAAANISVDPSLVWAAEPQTRASGVEGARQLLSQNDPPTAILASDNVIAPGVYSYLRQSGVAIPADVEVIAFDDMDWTSLTTPSLSVVAQPFIQMGQRAAELLIDRIGTQPGTKPARDNYRHVILPHELIHRESTRFSGA